MAFDLLVNFTGLCMLVPAGNRLHVLMPAVGTHHGGHDGPRVPAHKARLFYDMAHLTPGRAALDDELDRKDLKCRRLDLSTVGGTTEHNPTRPLDLTMPTELLDLCPLLPHKLDPGLLTLRPGAKVVSQVTLTTGAVECFEPGEIWTHYPASAAPRDIRISWWIRWKVFRIDAERLNVTLLGLDGASDIALNTLYPVDDRIDLYVYHSPHNQLPPRATKPPKPGLGTPPGHMHAFVGLYGAGAEFPTIEFKGGPSIGGCAPEWLVGKEPVGGLGGDPFTCALCQGCT